MKIKMQTKVIESGYVLNEEYDIENGKNPEKFANDLINNFNNTLRPSESPRELVSVEVIEEHSIVLHDHSWEKQNSVTIMLRGGGCYDIMRCKRCGVSGKRYGISGEIIRDSIFKGKCYDKCETALDQIQKNKQRLAERGRGRGK
jgi:hypothetical protein